MSLERITGPLTQALLAQTETIASRLAGVPAGELYLDAQRWAAQSRAAVKALGCRIVLLGESPCLAAEALGSTVDWTREFVSPAAAVAPALIPTARWTAYLAALERLTADRSAGPVVSMLPGPARLAHTLGLDGGGGSLASIKAALLALVESVCKRRPDLLLIEERTVIPATEPITAYRRLLSTMRNVARYFDVPLGFAIAAGDSLRDALVRLQPDVLLLTAAADEPLPGVGLVGGLCAEISLVGLPVDLSDPEGTRARVRSARSSLPQGRWCLCTARALPADIEIAPVRELVTELETT